MSTRSLRVDRHVAPARLSEGFGVQDTFIFLQRGRGNIAPTKSLFAAHNEFIAHTKERSLQQKPLYPCNLRNPRNPRS